MERRRDEVLAVIRSLTLSNPPRPSADETLATGGRGRDPPAGVPTPFAVGRVNCYLIEDEPLTLIDTGPNSGKSLDELEQALAAHGRTIEELELIVLTHQHMDHLGLLEILARRSGAEVAALHVLGPYLADFRASASPTTSSPRRSCAGTASRRPRDGARGRRRGVQGVRLARPE